MAGELIHFPEPDRLDETARKQRLYAWADDILKTLVVPVIDHDGNF
jgi:hypothetical protein